MTVFTVLAVLAAPPSPGAPPMATLPVERSFEWIWTATRNRPWRAENVLDQKQFDALAALLEAFLTAARAADSTAATRVAEPLKAYGYTLFAVPVSGGSALALADVDTGAGAFLVRQGTVAAEVILETPHRFHDLWTGNIGREMFDRTSLRAFFFNSAHRYAATGGEESTKSLSDMAHNERSQLSAFTLAAARVFRSATFVQLHGFGGEGAPEGVDAVVSAGGHPHTEAATILLRLLGTYTPRAKGYPEAIDVLGGTGNAQGKLLAKLDAAFVHVEMSPDLRQRLKDPATAASFAKVMVQAFARREK